MRIWKISTIFLPKPPFWSLALEHIAWENHPRGFVICVFYDVHHVHHGPAFFVGETHARLVEALLSVTLMLNSISCTLDRRIPGHQSICHRSRPSSSTVSSRKDADICFCQAFVPAAGYLPAYPSKSLRRRGNVVVTRDPSRRRPFHGSRGRSSRAGEPPLKFPRKMIMSP